jgi:hypothetical protein
VLGRWTNPGDLPYRTAVMRDALSADGPGWYARHSPLTDPGRHGESFAGLPRGVAALVRVVQGLVIHPNAFEHLGLPAGTYAEVAHLRFVADMLAHIVERDGRPLTVAREPAERVCANCRNPAVLLIAMLRHQGIPARKRTGFARYFADGHALIHEVAEFWDAGSGRWVLVDADVTLDAQSGYLTSHGVPEPADYGTIDLRSADGFVMAGDAWQRSRAGAADPDEFEGAGRGAGMPGIRQALLQDLDGLNRVELLSDDLWGGDIDEKPDHDLTLEDLVALDRAAELTLSADEHLDEMRRFYADSAHGRSVLARLAQVRPASTW